jgi:hypothetical protein
VLSLFTDTALISKVTVDRRFYINLYQDPAECMNEVCQVTLTLGHCPGLQALEAKLRIYFSLLLFLAKSALHVSNTRPVIVLIVFVFDPLNYRQ